MADRTVIWITLISASPVKHSEDTALLCPAAPSGMTAERAKAPHTKGHVCDLSSFGAVSTSTEITKF